MKSVKFILPLLALSVLLFGCSSTTDDAAPAASDGAADIELLSGMHTVTLKTSMGDITLELNADLAPKTVTNFVTHATDGYYDGLTFHRVIQNFMIQGGDPNGNGTGGYSIFGPTFDDEINAVGYGLDTVTIEDRSGGRPLPAGIDPQMSIKEYYETQGYLYSERFSALPMERGAIAMANAGANTNGSQFFIIDAEDGTPWLEGRHTVFGEVTDGLDIVDAIAAVEVEEHPVTGAVEVPAEEVTFTVEVE